MADLEFFFDPVCPFAWLTSRWVEEVAGQRNYDVTWRFISLRMINEAVTADWYTPEYKAGHQAGLYGLRVADAGRLAHGNEIVDGIYTAFGTAIHLDRRVAQLRDDPVAFGREVLGAAGLPVELADAALDESHDAYIRADSDLALERTGKDVGTPILTFHPGAADEGSFFGPVISKVPRGEQASKLWDAVELIATTPGMSELKRSNRAKLDFT
ncbi:MAG: DsbA family protein [Ilumatobacteraceae bacterium]